MKVGGQVRWIGCQHWIEGVDCGSKYPSPLGVVEDDNPLKGRAIAVPATREPAMPPTRFAISVPHPS
jgi:hypothetical protein